MGKSSPSPPAYPDPAATAAAQGAANKEAALTSMELSMVGQNTPYGTLTYQQTGKSEAGNPQYTATTTLSPDQQQLLNLQTQGQLNLSNLGIEQLGRIHDAVADPFSYEGLPGAPTADAAARQQALDTILARNQPQMDRDRAMLEQRLAQQGINIGSEAYSNAMSDLNRGVNDFRLGADVQAGNELAQQFGLAQSARQQAIQEEAYARDRPLSEFSAFMSGSQPTLPQFTATPSVQVQPADVLGANALAYQGQLNAYNSAQQRAAATTGGLFGLGSAAIGAAPWLIGGGGAASGPLTTGMALALSSDRRVKTDITHIGKLMNGLPFYAFRYIWDDKPTMGVMADEVEQVLPEAVVTVDGFKYVRYDMLMGRD